MNKSVHSWYTSRVALSPVDVHLYDSVVDCVRWRALQANVQHFAATGAASSGPVVSDGTSLPPPCTAFVKRRAKALKQIVPKFWANFLSGSNVPAVQQFSDAMLCDLQALITGMFYLSAGVNTRPSERAAYGACHDLYVAPLIELVIERVPRLPTDAMAMLWFNLVCITARLRTGFATDSPDRRCAYMFNYVWRDAMPGSAGDALVRSCDALLHEVDRVFGDGKATAGVVDQPPVDRQNGDFESAVALDVFGKKVTVEKTFAAFETYALSMVIFAEHTEIREKLADGMSQICVAIETTCNRFPKRMDWKMLQTLLNTLAHCRQRIAHRFSEARAKPLVHPACDAKYLLASARRQYPNILTLAPSSPILLLFPWLSQRWRAQLRSPSLLLDQMTGIVESLYASTAAYASSVLAGYILAEPHSTDYSARFPSQVGGQVSFALRYAIYYLRRLRQWLWAANAVPAAVRRRAFRTVFVACAQYGAARICDPLSTVAGSQSEQFRIDTLYFIRGLLHQLPYALSHANDTMQLQSAVDVDDWMAATKARLTQLTAALVVVCCPIAELHRLVCVTDHLPSLNVPQHAAPPSPVERQEQLEAAPAATVHDELIDNEGDRPQPVVVPFEFALLTARRLADLDNDVVAYQMLLFEHQPDTTAYHLLLELLYLRNCVVAKTCAAKLSPGGGTVDTGPSLVASIASGTCSPLPALVWVLAFCDWDPTALGDAFVKPSAAASAAPLTHAVSFLDARKHLQQMLWYKHLVDILVVEHQHPDLRTITALLNDRWDEPLTSSEMVVRATGKLLVRLPAAVVELGVGLQRDAHAALTPHKFLLQLCCDVYAQLIGPIVSPLGATGKSKTAETPEASSTKADAVSLKGCTHPELGDEFNAAVDDIVVKYVGGGNLVRPVDDSLEECTPLERLHIMAASIVRRPVPTRVDFDKMPLSTGIHVSRHAVAALAAQKHGEVYLRSLMEFVRSNVRWLRKQLFIAEPENLATLTTTALKHLNVSWRRLLSVLPLTHMELAGLASKRHEFAPGYYIDPQTAHAASVYANQLRAKLFPEQHVAGSRAETS